MGDRPTSHTHAGWVQLTKATKTARPEVRRQTVVTVGPNPDSWPLFEDAFAASQCAVLFVASIGDAYLLIRQVMPDWIVICLDIDDVPAFQLLSMLKLDRRTRAIPLVTYITERAGEETEEPSESKDQVAIQGGPNLVMN